MQAEKVSAVVGGGVQLSIAGTGGRACQKREVTQSEKREVTESKKREVTQTEKREVTQTEKREVTQTEKREVTESRTELRLKVTESQKREVTESRTETELQLQETRQTSTGRPLRECREKVGFFFFYGTQKKDGWNVFYTQWPTCTRKENTQSIIVVKYITSFQVH